MNFLTTENDNIINHVGADLREFVEAEMPGNMTKVSKKNSEVGMEFEDAAATMPVS
jgi:hypothetical protein